MKVFKSRLTKRFVITVILVVLFVLTSLYFVTVYVMNDSVRSQIEYRDELIAKTLGAQIETIIENAVDDMRQVSLIGDQDNAAEERYQVEIEKLISQDPLYLFIEVYDEDNQQLRTPDIPFSTAVDNQAVLDRLKWSKTKYISDMITLPDGRNTIAIAYPSLDREGDYTGAVIAYINLNILSDYLQKFSIGEEGLNAIVDRNGWILAHTDKEYIGTSIRKHEIGTYLKKERFGVWNGTIFEDSMYVSYRPLLLGDVGLIVSETIEQAMTPARKVALILLQGFLIVLALALILSTLGASRIVRPVTLLTKQVKEYKENKRDSFSDVHTNDEVEELSLVLSEMASSLQEKERSLFYILESIPYCVITTDKDGRIMTFNKGAENLTLYKREEVIGELIFDLPIKKNIREFILLKTLQEGKAFEEVESYIVDKNKQIHDVRIYSSMFTGKENEYIGSILVIRDVSELKKLEEYLKQSERLASLGQLTAGIAHEIKNPLSIIQAAGEAIQLELEDEEEIDNKMIQELTGDVLETSERMNKLLTDFLKLTKDNDYSQTEYTVDIIQITDELVQLLRKKMNDHDVSVHCEYRTDEALVIGNKYKFSQALLNILLNSIQAMPDGGTIEVTVEDVESDWVLHISDTGDGIPESQMKWIFNPLYSTKPEGTGLGLSISHEIITQNGGKLWAESEVATGTTFSIQLPKAESSE